MQRHGALDVSGSAAAAAVAAAAEQHTAAASSTPAAAAAPSGSHTGSAAAAHADIVSSFTSSTARRVLMGTCGWTDASILKCGRFYPGSVRTAVERLKHYASHFPCVEVDTSNYAIPGEGQVMSWMAATPVTFKFHVKIFGMFTAQRAETKAIPSVTRHLLPENKGQGVVQLAHTSAAFKDALWSVQNRVLHLLHVNGRLGVVIFQFHLGFGPTDAHRAHVAWCRAHLSPEFEMGVEFRNRGWFASEEITRRTLEFVRSLGPRTVLVAEDDLAHEVTGRFIPLPPGQTAVRLPIHLHIASPSSLYVRLHRRQGSQRVLADWELEEWAERFATARSGSAPPAGDTPPRLQGPIYFLIGTDHEDQPVINSNRMQATLVAYDRKRREEWEAKRAAAVAAAAAGGSGSNSTSPAAANNSAAAAASPALDPSAATSFVPASSLAGAGNGNAGADTNAEPEPEPLAFDYKAFYRAHLSRLSSGVVNDRQTSLGAFFGAKTAMAAQQQQPTDETKAAAAAADDVATFADIDVADDAERTSAPASPLSAAAPGAAAPAAAAADPSRLSSFFGVAPTAATHAPSASHGETKRKAPASSSSSAASPAKKKKTAASKSAGAPSITAFFKAK